MAMRKHCNWIELKNSDRSPTVSPIATSALPPLVVVLQEPNDSSAGISPLHLCSKTLSSLLSPPP
nr:hypothetical protein Itr_chr09CG16810 [Ipomoea trifida]GMD31174.1 hypothetical protein Iba_chr09aCG14000 [Ipomoea batatas]GMD32854.1 hypothetical protein Iba_chr09bCG12140 [Ipomoea batatas]GMD37902.1 hypothetical protein Iba_chr09eCG13830 [Ipomoea batatas]GME14050.1 hypothetical protein Iba_scaffold14897CG0890 [Ipomoea batatas]